MAAAGWTFVVGSSLFMAGVVLSLVEALSPAVAGWAYFVGSVFFTIAATFQTIASTRPDDRPRTPGQRWPVVDRANLVSALVQWVGTVQFNITTLLATLDATFSDDYTADAIWAPNAFGSMLFLISSAIALTPEVRTRRHAHVATRAQRIAVANMLGSIMFGVAALGAWPEADSGQPLQLAFVDVGTFLGALCFLYGSWLMIPPGAGRSGRHQDPTSPT